MEICHYNIDLSQVVGIGPLMLRRSSDPMNRQVYKEIQLYFVLIFRTISVTVESEWFCFADHLTDDDKVAETARKVNFEDSYNRNKKIILQQIERRETV